MFDPEDVELALLALEEGMTPRECVLSTRFEQNEHRNLSSLRTRRAQAF